MSYRRRTAECPEPACFSMPALKDETSIGRTSDHIEREAYEKGYASGEKAGYEMGGQKIGVLIDKLEALLADLSTLGPRIVKEAEPQCVGLAIAIARKILGRELAARPEDLIKMSKEALLKLERTGRITIRVNPLLFDLIAQHRPELAALHPEIVIEADPSVSRHGTVVTGPVDEVVTDLDEQMRSLVKGMADQLGANEAVHG